MLFDFVYGGSVLRKILYHSIIHIGIVFNICEITWCNNTTENKMMLFYTCCKRKIQIVDH